MLLPTSEISSAIDPGRDAPNGPYRSGERRCEHVCGPQRLNLCVTREVFDVEGEYALHAMDVHCRHQPCVVGCLARNAELSNEPSPLRIDAVRVLKPDH